MLTLKKGIEKKEWNQFVAENALDGGVLQSWEWGELEKAEGHGVWRLAWEEGGELVACCLLVERRLSFGWTYLYAPRGPIIEKPKVKSQKHAPYQREALVRGSKVIDVLEDFAREQQSIFLRIEPPYEMHTVIPAKAGIQNVSAIDSHFRGNDDSYYKISPVQPDKTLRIDCTQSEEQLLAAMHQKTRYNIGLAEKRGVVVQEGKDMDAFWKLLSETTQRDGFSGHTRVHYETILATLDAKFFFTTHEGHPLATALVVFFGKTAYYLHGASANEHRDMMAPYALHWAIIREAKRRGCTIYDLWGIDEKKWPGVTRFKQGFAPATPRTHYAGTYDLPISNSRYALYRMKKLFS